HEVVALQRRNFAFTAQICLMAAAAIRRVRLLAAVCLFLGVSAVPYALFCRLGGQTAAGNQPQKAQKKPDFFVPFVANSFHGSRAVMLRLGTCPTGMRVVSFMALISTTDT